jgi:hypothetical protein
VTTGAALRREISARNLARAGQHAHETTYGVTASVLYSGDEDGSHGNFFPASYRRILANPAWARRLDKAYTASARVPYAAARARSELDCAASSDALLMNVFCHPSALRSRALQALLGLDGKATPEFGVRVRTPLAGGLEDRTEIDMHLGDLLVEAKLSETGFQTGRPDLLARYEAFEQVFEASALPRSRQLYRGYQLVRGVLAAHHASTLPNPPARFAVLADAAQTSANSTSPSCPPSAPATSAVASCSSPGRSSQPACRGLCGPFSPRNTESRRGMTRTHVLHTCPDPVNWETK